MGSLHGAQCACGFTTHTKSHTPTCGSVWSHAHPVHRQGWRESLVLGEALTITFSLCGDKKTLSNCQIPVPEKQTPQVMALWASKCDTSNATYRLVLWRNSWNKFSSKTWTHFFLEELGRAWQAQLHLWSFISPIPSQEDGSRKAEFSEGVWRAHVFLFVKVTVKSWLLNKIKKINQLNN